MFVNLLPSAQLRIFLIAFVVFHGIGIFASVNFLDLLFYWCINGLLDNFCKRVFGILN
jgi:hypothetical protein